MRSTSSQPLTSTSAVRLRCQDPDRQRSPDGKHHEGLLAEHLRHVPAGQATVLHQTQEGPRRHQHCRRSSSTTEYSTLDPTATGGEVSSRTSEGDLPTWQIWWCHTRRGTEKINKLVCSTVASNQMSATRSSTASNLAEERNYHPPASRAQHDERKSTQDRNTKQRRLRHLSNTRDYRTLPAQLFSPATASRRSAPRLHPDQQTLRHQDHSHNRDLYRRHLRLWSCHPSFTCKQTRSSSEDYATSTFAVRKMSLNTNSVRPSTSNRCLVLREAADRLVFGPSGRCRGNGPATYHPTHAFIWTLLLTSSNPISS